MSSSQKLKRKSQTKQEEVDEMKDFIVNDGKHGGYEGSSDSQDDYLDNAANLQDAPMIQQTKAEMKISGKKIEEIFADKESDSDSDDDLLQLLAKQKELQKRKNMVLEEVLDVSKLDAILENSRAKQKKPAPIANKNSALEFPCQVLTSTEAQTKFKELPDTVNVYLTEVYQNHTDKRKLFVFGTTQKGDRVTIQVKDVNKCLYFVMRQGQEDEERIEDEIRQRLKRSGVDEYDGEFLKMQYVFEIEGLPRGEVLTYRVKYPFTLELNDPPKPDWEGLTYKYVIGTTYSALELFVVKNKIKGPQWIALEKQYLQVNTKLHGVTGLPLELFVPDDIQTPQKPLQIPKLRVVSFAVKVTKPADVKKNNIFPANAQRDKPIIYAISLQYHPNYNVESKTKNLAIGMQSIVFCLSSFGQVPTNQKNIKIFKCENELELLSRFFEAIEGFDPDILVCHDATMALDTIITRADHLNIKEKARMGRLGNNRLIPNIPNMKQRQMLVLAGRLLVDTYVHAKDLLKSVDYSLSFLSVDNPIGGIQDIKTEQANSMLANGEWMKLVLHCNSESEGAFALMNHLEIVQLTRQLTNICGNLWRRSLDNARAERNEYLMMHECEESKIIVPDKFYREKDAEEDSKKEKYEGGYVIEPEKDLYSEYILLLDFNSLYPSIIRQYNICFSKVKRNLLPLSYYYKPRAEGRGGKKNEKNQKSEKKEVKRQEERKTYQQYDQDQNRVKEEEEHNTKLKVEPVPEEERVKANWGFLPQLINNVVMKRGEYKKKMLALTTLPSYELEKRQDQYMAFEITQRSYKLVANSIYGCLGFENSRFYARDLAALITQKGRDALRRAKELVERSGKASVIYGDTDSLMIKIDMEEGWSEVDKIRYIHKIADKLKGDINKEYTNRMLEIDIDGVFKPLNLIAKKKYMAKKVSNLQRVRRDGVQPVFTVEYKGIEVAKRDGCERARKAIRDVFDIVLNNVANIDDATSKIYEYFQALDREMSAISGADYKQYLLAKQLNKHPSQYKNGAENLPHIRVAKRLIEHGEKAEKLVNHAIYYLIVETENEKASVADKAVDEASFLRSLKSSNPMKIDANHYKVHQILPPIIRVLANIKSLDVGYIRKKFNIAASYQKEFDRLEAEDNRQYEGEGQTLNTNHDAVVNNALGQLVCPGDNCTKRYPICKNGVFISKCNREGCQYNKDGSLYRSIQNLASKYMFVKATISSTPQHKCRKCGKKWKVQIRECCPGSKFQQIAHVSQLHNVMYALQKVLSQSHNKQTKSHLPIMKKWLTNFLQQSSFEVVQSNFMKGLKFKE